MNDVSMSTTAVQEMLAAYDLGPIQTVTPLTTGTVQTNLLIQTTQGKFVLRHYRQNRSFESVLFEADVINYLQRCNYPCPALLPNKAGEYVELYQGQPYALFEFLEGGHVEQPTFDQQRQLIQKVAELQSLTQGYEPVHVEARWNYGVAFCAERGQEIAQTIGTANAAAKLAWYQQRLAELELPGVHPMGICHCDFHFSNVLFKDGTFHALLDFDDANYTYLTFDLVSLIEPELFTFRWDSWQAVPPNTDAFDFAEARKIVAVYQQHRALTTVEQLHLFDVLKLAILIDCLWFFERGEARDFYEKRKLDCLDALGRDAFARTLFGHS